MNKQEPMTTLDDPDQAELSQLLAEGLAPLVPAVERETRLRKHLLQRVAHSARQEAGLLTVRMKSGIWRKLKPGVRFKHLWSGSDGHSVLIEFEPGASLPAHRHTWMEEGVVLHGDLRMGDLVLGPLDYQLSAIGSRHAAIESQQGALAYLRGTSLGDKASVFGEFLGGILPFSGEPSRTVVAGDADGWTALTEGVTQKMLSSDALRASYFYRLEPEAELPEHIHAQDEECMVLQGEVFLGDILLRAWDYQLAPAKSKHGKVYTDVGAIVFVRGAKASDDLAG